MLMVIMKKLDLARTRILAPHVLYRISNSNRNNDNYGHSNNNYNGDNDGNCNSYDTSDKKK